MLILQSHTFYADALSQEIKTYMLNLDLCLQFLGDGFGGHADDLVLNIAAVENNHRQREQDNDNCKYNK
jgi:hypothetical protein